RKEVKIGLTVVASVVLLYLALTWVKSMHLFAANRQKVNIHFADVAGLKEGDQVVVYGYPSGNVRQIKLVRGGVDVTVALEKDVELFADATAEVQVKEMLGGKHIVLTPGVSNQPLSAEAVVPGTASLDFGGIFSRIGKFMNMIEGQEFDSLLHNINNIVNSMADLSENLKELDAGRMLNQLEKSSESLSNMLSEAERRQIVQSLDRSLRKVDGLAGKADQTLDAVTNLTNKVSNQTLPEADNMLKKVTGMLDDAESMMTTVRDLVKQMQDPTTVAGRILYDPQMSKDLDFTLDQLNKTLEHLRTKKVYVTMTLGKKQRKFKEEIEKEAGKDE
ncbi:MAG: MlaD family protein, partial [Bacteroidota bacterium]